MIFWVITKYRSFFRKTNNAIVMLSTFSDPEEPMALCGNSDTDFY